MKYPYQTYATPQILSQQFALLFATWTEQQLQTKRSLYIALSGGSTPQLWFEALTKDYTERINWERLHFFWVDERYVPHSHPESNYGVARNLLFNMVDIPESNLHPVPVSGNIEHDIYMYRNEIGQHVPHNNGWPIFDLITLGMGTDGHTASIFPGQLDLFDTSLTVCKSQKQDTKQQRITLSGIVINQSSIIYFLITGNNKAKLINNIFREAEGNENYPASHIRKDNTIWLFDSEAAGMLPHN